MTHEASVVVFIAQIVTLLIAGRVVGELMQRIGQPAVMGQILAGVVLGPSVLGTAAPGLWHELFPSGAEQKAMLDAVAQLGILLLLLMTGLETDLAVFRHRRAIHLRRSARGLAAAVDAAEPGRAGDHRLVSRHRDVDLFGEDRGAGSARPGLRASHRGAGDHRLLDS
jgi:predicted Kef-type K+ transport protein